MNQGHRRNRKRRNAIVLVAGLAAGGVGLALVTMQANATDAPRATTRAASPISCPSVADRLPEVPRPARAEVDRNLELLRSQITEAGNRLAATRGQGGPGFVQNAILGPLKDKRTATVDRIALAISRTGAPRPQGLSGLAACTLAGGQGQQGQGQQGQQGQKGQGASPSPAAGNGPVPEDFVDITKVAPNVPARPRSGRNASKGAFKTRCGVNAEGRHNSDNVIVAPGVGNGAHHTHDYVGATGVDAFTTDDTLAAADTTCTNGDRSTYYWPVLRDRGGVEQADAGKPGGGAEGNIGKILTPTSANLTFVGSPTTKVVAMPRFLRIITGDAKANANGGANANAAWSCTGFENRVQLKDKYPICPAGSEVVRTERFQSCWDGRNTDSANHRSHVAFADARGRCPAGFKAVPQLVQRLTYSGLAGSTAFAVDSFPESLHKPITDHGDFINAMPERLMKQAVSCINSGRRCG
ncbi:DUF1996 domain-containing protein [Streptomyces sp. NEAU-H22]|uniref:DUF1996 domain-containing protein n=1 Tax=Streptomyces sp. NEAU-H22 TaxID=2994655 RepID=UPI0022558617|nr:DUF1996 domain-containing protein [Streptomyces sp. NEAU-H22]MCX3287656.1 DUF1996 domain-containing protein [Streptomyces sp. NEAU-H22]